MAPRLLIVTLVALLVLVGCGADDEVAATVEGVPITVDELSDRYARFILQAGLRGDDPRLRHDLLQSLVNKRLIVQEAYDEGVAQTPAYQAEMERARRKALVDFYTARILYDTLEVTDRDLRELFVRANTQITARHLYARTHDQAEALRARLEAGEPFEALAREVFADSELAASGGLVGSFGFDEMDPAFEEAAFRLPIGAVSEPVRTAQGYSIIRVEDRVTRPLLTETEFAQKQSDLRQYALKRKRTEARFHHSRALLEELQPAFDAGAFEALVATARGEGGALLEMPLQQRPLVTFGPEDDRQVWTVADVEAQAQFASERQLAAVQSAEALEEFIHGLLVREAMLARARAAGLDREPAYEAAVTRAMEDWVFAQARQRLVEAVRVPEDSVRAHFTAHGLDYQTPERVRVHEILLPEREAAQRLKRQLEAGADFATLARTHSIRPGARSAAGDLGLLSREELGMLAGPVFEAEVGALVGPIEVAEHYVLLRVGAREAPRPMTYEEARLQIEDELREDFAQAHLERHLAALRARYRVTINEAALERIRLFS